MTELTQEQLEGLLSELQSRLGNIVVNYETQIAVLTLNSKTQSKMYEEKIKELQELIDTLQG